VTRGTDLGRFALGPGSLVADRLLPIALVSAIVGDLLAAATPRELAIASNAARRAADPLRRPRAGGRGEPAAALGASSARDHALSVSGAAEVRRILEGSGGVGREWITKAPRAAASGGGVVDQ
jgi:hypothetical protein